MTEETIVLSKSELLLLVRVHDTASAVAENEEEEQQVRATDKCKLADALEASIPIWNRLKGVVPAPVEEDTRPEYTVELRRNYTSVEWTYVKVRADSKEEAGRIVLASAKEDGCQPDGSEFYCKDEIVDGDPWEIEDITPVKEA